MAKLEFKVAADYKEVDRLAESVDRLESKVKGLKTSDLGLNDWLNQFDRFKHGLQEKAGEIEALKAKIVSFDDLKDKKALDGLARQLQTAKTQYSQLAQEAVDGANSFQASFTRASSALLASRKNVDSVTWRLIEQKEVVANLQSEVRRLNDAYRAVSKDEKGAISSQLTSKKQQLENERVSLNNLRAEQERARLAVKGLKDEMSGYDRAINSLTNAQEKNEISLKKLLATFGGVAAIKVFVSDMVQVRGEFQKTQMAFETMLGSKEKADMLMSQMIQTAAKTPFDLQGVADGAKQLLAYGTEVKDVNETLIRLGNIASGLNIPLGEMVYLYGTTQTQGRLFTQDVRQFMGRGIPLVKELATMLGKTEEEINKMVTAGQIGFPQVQQVIEIMTNEGGKFYNLMEKQSQTLSGQISNLGDAWDQMLNSIGEDTQDLTSSSISLVTTTIENYQKVGEILAGLIMMYGSYKAAAIAYYSISRTYGVYDIATKGLQFAATMKNVVATQFLTAKQAILNKLILLNPYALLAAAVVGVVSAMIYMNKETDYAGKAQKRLNNAIKEAEKGALSERRELSKLKGKLSATTKGTDEYNAIRDKIVANYGKYDKNLKDEIDRVGLLDTTYQNLTKSIQQSFNVRQYDKFKQEQSSSLDDVMSDNLDSMYDKLVGKWGDELGAKYYTEIKNALMAGEEIPKHLNNVVSNMYGIWGQSLHNYINNIREAQKATEEADKKAQVKFGIEGGTENNSESGKTGGKTVLSSVSDEIKAVTEKISTLKQEISDLRSGKTSAAAGKTVQAVIEEKAKELKTAEEALSVLTGRDKSFEKKSEDEQKKQLEKQKAIFAQLLELRLQNQQAEINLMQEGSEKKIAQINLDYDKEIAAILAKEKEWKDAQGGKLTKEQTVEIHTAFKNAYVKREQSTGVVSEEQLEEEKRMMNEYLKEYGSYMEKRQAIIELYNDRIAKATTEGERLSLGEEMKKALATVDDEAQKKTSIITKLFSDMSSKSVAEIRSIADEAQKMLDYVNGGEFKTDSEGKGLFGLTKEQFDILSKSPEKLQAVKDEIANVRREADQCENSFNKMSSGLRKVFSAGDDSKKLKDGLEEISDGMNDVMQTGQFLADTLSNLGDALGSEALSGAAEGINVAMDAASSAMSGAKAGAMFGPWGAAAGAAIGLVSSLGSSLAKLHDAKHEKKIQRIADQIEVLDKSYEKLSDSIEKAYSTDASKMIEQQNELLEQQKVLIQQQIREEEEKKKTDKDRIKEWREQIEDIDKTLADNEEKAKDAIFGEDLKSAIDNFAEAYAEAWAGGEDRAMSMKEVAKNMIKQTIIELIKSSEGLGETVKKIREMIIGYLSDGVVDEWEQRELDAYIDSETARLDAKYGWADKYLKEDKELDLGVSSDSLADTIIEGLKAGKTGIKDFSSSFEDMMKTAVLNSLKAKYLEGPLKEFQKKFAELSESGGQLTEAEIEELRQMYADIIEGANTQFDALKEVSGLDFFEDSDNTLKGAFAKASQESIDLLAGQAGAQRVAIENIREQMRFIYDLQKQGWQNVAVIKELCVKIREINERIAVNTGKVEEATAQIVESAKRSAESLDSLDSRGIKVKM